MTPFRLDHSSGTNVPILIKLICNGNLVVNSLIKSFLYKFDVIVKNLWACVDYDIEKTICSVFDFFCG